MPLRVSDASGFCLNQPQKARGPRVTAGGPCPEGRRVAREKSQGARPAVTPVRPPRRLQPRGEKQLVQRLMVSEKPRCPF